MSILDNINTPADLKSLPRNKLPELAADIRRLIVDVVSKNGGHLASSLGVVELTIAIHYVFDIPVDKLIWDVGHQAYAHKLLTGRKERFHTLRKHEGLSGFTRISESPFDAFSTGHASTSIFRATEDGRWKKLACGLPQPLDYMAYALLTNPDAPGHLYAGLSNGDIWHSSDHGDTWVQLPLNLKATNRALVGL